MGPRVEMSLNGRSVVVVGGIDDKLRAVTAAARRLWSLTEPAAAPEPPAGGSVGSAIGFTAEHGGTYPTAVTDADPSRTGGLGGYIGL